MTHVCFEACKIILVDEHVGFPLVLSIAVPGQKHSIKKNLVFKRLFSGFSFLSWVVWGQIFPVT